MYLRRDRTVISAHVGSGWHTVAGQKGLENAHDGRENGVRGRPAVRVGPIHIRCGERQRLLV